MLLDNLAVQRPQLKFGVPGLKDVRNKRAARTTCPSKRLEAGRCTEMRTPQEVLGWQGEGSDTLGLWDSRKRLRQRVLAEVRGMCWQPSPESWLAAPSQGIFKRNGHTRVMGVECDNPLLTACCARHPRDWVKCWTSICQKQFKSSCSHCKLGLTSEMTPPSPAPGDAVMQMKPTHKNVLWLEAKAFWFFTPLQPFYKASEGQGRVVILLAEHTIIILSA